MAIESALASQRALLESWLAGDEARAVASRLVRRRGLQRSADELVHEAWLRVQATFGRRTEPYPSLGTAAEATRFGARVLDNLSRDWARSQRRSVEVELVDAVSEDRDGAERTEQRLLLEQLLGVIGRRAHTVTCAGCPPEVVVAAALEVVHLVLAGRDGGERGRTWMDQMLHLALERVDGDRGRSEGARNQRASRCGRCVRELLMHSMGDLLAWEP